MTITQIACYLQTDKRYLHITSTPIAITKAGHTFGQDKLNHLLYLPCPLCHPTSAQGCQDLLNSSPILLFKPELSTSLSMRKPYPITFFWCFHISIIWSSPTLLVASRASSSLAPISWKFNFSRSHNYRKAVGQLACLLAIIDGISLHSS